MLDEATSSLDADSEKIVQNAIKNLTKNKTTLVIAHRLSTVYQADVIFVMKNGELISSDTKLGLVREKIEDRDSSVNVRLLILKKSPSAVSNTFGWKWFIPLVVKYKWALLLVFAATMVAQVKNGVVYPFEDMAEKYGVASNKDDYIPGIRNFYADSDGKMIGIPFNSSTCLMYANMDVLEAAGVTEIPKTYEDFEAVAQQIKDAGYIPLLQSHSPWIWTENYFSRHNLLMTDGNNGYDAVPTTTLFADTPEFIMHWTKAKEWKDKGWWEYKGTAWSDNQAPFIAGEAAFWLGSAASFSGMKGIVPNFTVNHIPYWSSVTGGKEYPTFIGGAANWILSGKTDAEYEQIMRIAEFMTTPEIQLFYHKI